MKLDFLTAKDKAFYQDSKQVTRAFGSESAEKLKTRLDELGAAQSMDAMRTLPGHWEELRKDRAGQFSGRLPGGLRLIVKAQRQPPPFKPDGGLDWCAIDSLYIVEVVDHHD